jgi:excisionase family DNA binding protein
MTTVGALGTLDLADLLRNYAREFAKTVVEEVRAMLTSKFPALLSAGEVASILGISERQVWRMNSAEELPAPKTVGSLTKWRRSEIEAWVEN